jgi:hypothetical protein
MKNKPWTLFGARVLVGAIFWTLIVLSCGYQASAGPISIVNPSFEAPALAPGTFNSGAGGPITGWTNTGFSGVFYPIIGFNFFSIPDGHQTAVIASGTVSQVLSAALLNSTTYTLQVDVGARLDCCTLPAYAVQLWAGPTLLSTAPIVSPAPGNFLTATAAYTSLAADPSAGQALSIVLNSVSGSQVNFDNVRLNSSSTASGVPEPVPSVLILASLCALLAGKRMTAK